MRKLGRCLTFMCVVFFVLCLPMLAQAQEPVGWWTFEKGVELEDIAGNFPDLELKGAEVADGQLDVGAGKWAVTVGDYKGPDITEKTMVAWLSLDDLSVLAGSALTIDKISADEFDAMVFGERVPQQWMPGSSNFKRTSDFPDAFTEKEEGVPIKLIYTYEDDGGQARITGYRNDESLDGYTLGAIVTHVEGDAEVFFGIRHGNNAAGGPGNLDAHIEEARIYNRVLSVNEMKALQVGTLPVEARGKLTTLWGAMKAK